VCAAPAGTRTPSATMQSLSVAPAPTGFHLGYNLLALEVEDMGKALDFLKSKGVPCVWGPVVREGHFARAEITDPDGYHIELRQWL